MIMDLRNDTCDSMKNDFLVLYQHSTQAILQSSTKIIRTLTLITPFLDIQIHGGGGRKLLPKFIFSAKFENDCFIMWKIILTENPSRCNLAPLLK